LKAIGRKKLSTLKTENRYGKIVMDSMQIKSGFIAHVLDSEGNKIALFALKS